MANSATYGSWLETVRVARGFTQARLGAETGLGQGVISKLEGQATPFDEARVHVLASALAVPERLIDGGAPLPAHVRVFHRKQASLPARAANRLLADMVLAHLRVERLVADQAQVDIPRWPLESAIDRPEERARDLRREWGVGAGPIPNMVELVEEHGVPCLSWDVASARVDAIASWPDAGYPIILLGAHAPGDRLRFTVAHELGHAVMHDLPAADREREADAFASEFLMPRRDIQPSLRELTLPRLAELKREWGTSMAAIMRRARDIGAITDYAYRDFNISMSASGYRKNEPIEVNREQPTLVRDAIARRRDGGETLGDIAADAYISVDELKQHYLEVR